MYIWTDKAEARAQKLNLEARQAEQPAVCGNDPVSGQIAQAWLKMEYIKEVVE
jgi:hypothetical protein